MASLLALAAVVLLQGSQDGFRRTFEVDKSRLAPTGRSRYFILEPGYQLVLDGKEEGASTKLVVDVLNATKEIDGVTTRVVREKETHGGKLVEISMNYFAIDPRSKDVYYFGEDVDLYRAGKVVGHEGAWRSGVKGARFGLAVPGAPKPGQRYYQEVADGVALDRALVQSVTTTFASPAGTFKGCLRVEETTPLEPGAKEYKTYAPGVGLVMDSGLRLRLRRWVRS